MERGIKFHRKYVQQEDFIDQNDEQLDLLPPNLPEETSGSLHSDEKIPKINPYVNDSQEALKPENVAVDLMDFPVEEGENFSEAEVEDLPSSYEVFEVSEIIEELQEDDEKETPYLDSVFKNYDTFSKVIEEGQSGTSTQCETIPSSSNNRNLDPLKSQNPWIESGLNSGFNHSKAEPIVQINDNPDAMEVEGKVGMEEEKSEVKSNSVISPDDSPPNKSERKPKTKQSSKMKTLPGLFMVEVKRAYQYDRTRSVHKKKYELQSIGRVIHYGNIKERILKGFDQWIKKYKPKTKTYKELLEFLAENRNTEMENLLKKFAICIFKNEKEVWLEKSGTKKKQQFYEVLDTFATTFSYVLEYKTLPH